MRWSEGVATSTSSGSTVKAANAIAAAVFRGVASCTIRWGISFNSALAKSIFCVEPTNKTSSHTFWFRSIVNPNKDFPLKNGKYCLGLDLRDKGHKRDPTPPERITLIIRLIYTFYKCLLIKTSSLGKCRSTNAGVTLSLIIYSWAQALASDNGSWCCKSIPIIEQQ